MFQAETLQDPCDPRRPRSDYNHRERGHHARGHRHRPPPQFRCGLVQQRHCAAQASQTRQLLENYQARLFAACK